MKMVRFVVGMAAVIIFVPRAGRAQAAGSGHGQASGQGFREVGPGGFSRVRVGYLPGRSGRL